MSKTKIPDGVYFNINMDAFYDHTGRGKGEAFYKKWQDRASEFPRSQEAAQMVMAKKGKLPPKVRPGIYIPTSKATRQTKAETPKPKGRELWASGDIGMIVQVVLPHVHEEDALQLLWKHFTNNDPEIKLDDYWRGVFRERHGWAIKAVLEAANGSD